MGLPGAWSRGPRDLETPKLQPGVCGAGRLATRTPSITALPPSPHTGFLDWVPKKMQRVGCVELLNTVQRRVQPRLHVFGHIHEGG